MSKINFKYFQHRDTKENNLDIKFEFNDENKKVIFSLIPCSILFI